MTYNSRVASQPAGHRRLATAATAALCLSLVTIGLAIAGLLHLEAQYGEMGHPPQLARLAFHIVHSGPWLVAALLFAGGLFALAFVLARRLGAWLVFLAPLAYVTVLVSVTATIWLPLRSLSQVVK